MKILVDDGEMFEGSLEQFQDCFFSNADEETIKVWAKDNNYKVEFVKPQPNKDGEEILKNLQQSLQCDYERCTEFLSDFRYSRYPNIKIFLERILAWQNDKTKKHNIYAMFRRANIECESLGFFGSLNSFIGNCLLDDSSFTIEWVKADYIETTEEFRGIIVPHFEIQWLPGGDFKRKQTTKDDLEGRPEVIWAKDDNGSQNVELLLEAMDIYEEREKKRTEDFEKVWK